MDLVLFTGVISLELILAVVELLVLIIVLLHMKKMREHSEIERKELGELRRLHTDLKEAFQLLKEDIKELNENQTEMHKIIKILAKKHD